MLERVNEAIAYIERNLCGEVDLGRAAKIACVTQDSFLRFFSYITGMTLAEYIRRRRLTLAAEDLRQGNERIVDIAVKYGWDSADAFSRAFSRQHGMAPAVFRRQGGSLTVFPPASFRIIIKGAQKMNFRLIDLPETALYGLSREYDPVLYPDRELLRNHMWSEEFEDVPGKICLGHWNEPGNHNFDGVWYGLWQDGRYMIAREPEYMQGENLERRTLPAGLYAAFTTEKGGKAWEELPRLRELIFESWLPASGYCLAGEEVVEVLHLWTDKEQRAANRYYEMWVPVKPAK